VRVAGVARRYDVAVKPGDETRLAIDWDLESRLNVSDSWVGVTDAFTGEAHELRDAIAFAKLACGDHRVIAISMTFGPNNDVVSGKLYDTASGGVERHGQVLIPRGSDAHEQLRHLAHYLVTGGTSSDLLDDSAPIPATTNVSEAPAATANRDGHLSRLLPATLISLGGVAVVVGGVMISQTNYPSPRDTQQRYYTNYRPPGIGIAIGGVVSLGVGLALLLWHRDRQGPTIGFQRLPSGGIGAVGWMF
jgi:hypothetical protein